MIKTVVKKDGTKVPFDKNKIKNSFVLAAKESGSVALGSFLFLPGRIVKVVLDAVGNKEEVSTTEIKNIILTYLDKEMPKVAAAWRDYDKKNNK